jgi:hypothetical protein
MLALAVRAVTVASGALLMGRRPRDNNLIFIY